MNALLIALLCQCQLITGFTGGNDLSVGPGTAGYSFTVGPSDIIVRSLGLYDWDGGGLAAPHAVGIWSADRTLLDSATVNPATAHEFNSFWYADAPQITLRANTTYVIAAQYADIDFDLAHGNAVAVSAAAATLGDALLSTGTGFTFPDLALPQADFGFFGPNLSSLPASAVPEPASAAAVAALLLVLALAFRKSSRST